MLKIFYPKIYAGSLTDIDPDMLIKRSIKGILFDLDNTIVCRNASRCDPEVLEWLGELRGRGFKMGIVSNNSARRVGDMAAYLDMPAVYRAVKPFRRPFLRALRMLGTPPHETALIGDQIFTDILGGNMAGLYTILVAPLAGTEFLGTRLFSRPLEKIIMPRLKKEVERFPRQ